jgi:hypothetical protein
MTRRIVLNLLAARPPNLAPDDMFALNKFAELYNEYIAKLIMGNRDVRQWKLTKSAFERLHN